MCMVPSFHYWLMLYLLEHHCDGSKNKLADMLSVNRQTLGRAFRRVEQENAGVTPIVSEPMLRYLFEHQDILNDAIKDYEEYSAELCPLVGKRNAERARLSEAEPAPRYNEAIALLENLKKAMKGKKPTSNVCYSDRYCRMYERCPIQQLVAMFDQYLSSQPQPPKGE